MSELGVLLSIVGALCMGGVIGGITVHTINSKLRAAEIEIDSKLRAAKLELMKEHTLRESEEKHQNDFQRKPLAPIPGEEGWITKKYFLTIIVDISHRGNHEAFTQHRIYVSEKPNIEMLKFVAQCLATAVPGGREPLAILKTVAGVAHRWRNHEVLDASRLHGAIGNA